LLEHEGLYPPIGWLHEFTIVQGPLFTTPQSVQLAKLNLIYGMNCTGKTAITEWISGFFNCERLRRWMRARAQPLNLRLALLNPKLQNLSLTVTGSNLHYTVDGKSVAFIPIGFAIFKPNRMDFSVRDDVEMIAQALGVSELVVQSLAEEVNRFKHQIFDSSMTQTTTETGLLRLNPFDKE
jgi:hypothetical protein